MAKRKQYPKSWHVRSCDDRDIEVLQCEVLRSSIKNDGREIVQIRINGSTFRVCSFSLFDRREDAYDDAIRTAALRLESVRSNMRRLEMEARQ